MSELQAPPPFLTCCDAWHAGSTASAARAAGAPCPGCGALDAGAKRAIAELHTEALDFGVDDRFGRRVGAQVKTWEATCGGVTSWWARASATRSGEVYGATQPDRYFATAGEREAWLRRYVTDARRRALARRR